METCMFLCFYVNFKRVSTKTYVFFVHLVLTFSPHNGKWSVEVVLSWMFWSGKNIGLGDYSQT